MTYLQETFQKFWLSCPVFVIVFVIIFINSINQHCIPSWNFSKWAFSNLYRIIIWKFGIAMVSIKQVVWEPIKYLIIFLIYVTWAKARSYIYSSIQTKKVEKILKNEAAEPYLEPCQMSIMERFYIKDVW